MPNNKNNNNNDKIIIITIIIIIIIIIIIAEKMHNYLEPEKILPEEQKGCKRGSCGTKDQLLIDKMVLKDCKKRHTNLSIAWIDFRKAYDLVPHGRVNECMEMFGIAENLRMFCKIVCNMRGYR